VESVHADYNDRVSKGQVLVELDKRQLRARVTEARSRLEAARTALVEARATAREAQKIQSRTQRLVKADVAPEQQLDTTEATAERARAAIQSAEAQISVAQAALDAAKTDLAWATIRSPIDGIVLSRSVEPGQAVAATFQPPTLFVIAEGLKDMELLVDIDEADVGRVETKQVATFTVDAYPGRVFDAEVQTVRNLPRNVQGVVTYEA